MRGMGPKGLAAVAALAGAVVGAGVVLAVAPWSPVDPRVEGTSPTATATGQDVTIFAAGDIARCNDEGDEETAEIVAEDPDATVLGLGDMAYDSGTEEDFQECYDPSWGQFLPRTRPVPGNHEYRTDDAEPYFDYFGSAAGPPGKGWYSFELGEWHIVALNSNCDDVDCDEGSEQYEWLREDLAENAKTCTLAFWHAPRFSSGATHAGTKSMEDFWQLLLEHDVELVLSGHEHLYERTAPLGEDGEVDPENGIRQFVVGTGGGNFYDIGERIPGSEAAIVDTNGVLRMTLGSGTYDWQFVPTTPDAPSDVGSDECR